MDIAQMQQKQYDGITIASGSCYLHQSSSHSITLSNAEAAVQVGYDSHENFSNCPMTLMDQGTAPITFPFPNASFYQNNYLRGDDPEMNESNQFPLPEEFEAIVQGYLRNLSSKKRDKALVDRHRYTLIVRVLKDPRNTAVSTAQFRFWVKKMFQLVSLRNGVDIVCHDNKPVAMREHIYDILVHAHKEANHGGRDKTSALVRRQYSWIPKELIARFVRHCPFCISRRNGGQSPTTDYLPRTPPDYASAMSARSTRSAQPATFIGSSYLPPRLKTDSREEEEFAFTTNSSYPHCPPCYEQSTSTSTGTAASVSPPSSSSPVSGPFSVKYAEVPSSATRVPSAPLPLSSDMLYPQPSLLSSCDIEPASVGNRHVVQHTFPYEALSCSTQQSQIDNQHHQSADACPPKPQTGHSGRAYGYPLASQQQQWSSAMDSPFLSNYYSPTATAYMARPSMESVPKSAISIFTGSNTNSQHQGSLFLQHVPQSAYKQPSPSPTSSFSSSSTSSTSKCPSPYSPLSSPEELRCVSSNMIYTPQPMSTTIATSESCIHPFNDSVQVLSCHHDRPF